MASRAGQPRPGRTSFSVDGAASAVDVLPGTWTDPAASAGSAPGTGTPSRSAHRGPSHSTDEEGAGRTTKIHKGPMTCADPERTPEALWRRHLRSTTVRADLNRASRRRLAHRRRRQLTQDSPPHAPPRLQIRGAAKRSIIDRMSTTSGLGDPLRLAKRVRHGFARTTRRARDPHQDGGQPVRTAPPQPGPGHRWPNVDRRSEHAGRRAATVAGPARVDHDRPLAQDHADQAARLVPGGWTNRPTSDRRTNQALDQRQAEDHTQRYPWTRHRAGDAKHQVRPSVGGLVRQRARLVQRRGPGDARWPRRPALTAACRWSNGLVRPGHAVDVLGGPRAWTTQGWSQDRGPLGPGPAAMVRRRSPGAHGPDRTGHGPDRLGSLACAPDQAGGRGCHVGRRPVGPATAWNTTAAQLPTAFMLSR